MEIGRETTVGEIAVAHCWMHAQGILPALQINLIFFLLVFSFSSSSFSSSLLIRVWQCLLLACPTSIHRRSVDDGMAAVCVCVCVCARARVFLSSSCARSLVRSNLVMHSNWPPLLLPPPLHIYTNGDAERLEKEGKWRRRRQSREERELLLIVVTTRQHRATDERRERRVFFFCFFPSFLLLLFSFLRQLLSLSLLLLRHNESY